MPFQTINAHQPNTGWGPLRARRQSFAAVTAGLRAVLADMAAKELLS